MLEHKIINLLKDKEEDITISEIASSLAVDRHTAAKHLEVLKGKGLVECRNIGKSRVWKVSKNPFINALKNNDAVINNFKDILKQVDDHVNIQSKNLDTIWTNKNLSKHKCYETIGNGKKCKNCPIEKTFKSGSAHSAIFASDNGKIRILTQPIKDSNNNTVAVVEIVKKIK